MSTSPRYRPPNAHRIRSQGRWSPATRSSDGCRYAVRRRLARVRRVASARSREIPAVTTWERDEASWAKRCLVRRSRSTSVRRPSAMDGGPGHRAARHEMPGRVPRRGRAARDPGSAGASQDDDRASPGRSTRGVRHVGHPTDTCLDRDRGEKAVQDRIDRQGRYDGRPCRGRVWRLRLLPVDDDEVFRSHTDLLHAAGGACTKSGPTGDRRHVGAVRPHGRVRDGLAAGDQGRLPDDADRRIVHHHLNRTACRHHRSAT